MRKAIAIVLFMVCIARLASEPAGAVGPLTASALAGKSICLDAGHGGAQGGAVNQAYGLDESEINLDVAYALKALLEGDGATIHMTRKGNEAVAEMDRQSFCNRSGADIAVSVHTNSVADSAWNGAVTLYNKEADLPLARAIQEAMLAALRDTAPDRSAFTDFGLMQRRVRVLRSDMPAALAEPVFMSNAAEAALLRTPIHVADMPHVGDMRPNFNTRRGQIALAIHDGVLRYFGALGPPPPTPIPAPTRTPRPPRFPDIMPPDFYYW
jgi:N-acetylmuramoyl-L-alanine amidase